jgi:hypothetical protein
MLDDPNQYEPPPMGAAGASSGGSPASGGAATTGGTGSPTGGAGGAGTTAGSGGTPFGLPDAGCNYVEILQRTCASGTCHRSTLPSAGLDLTPGTMLLGRVYNQPAQHRQIVCTDLSACMPPATPCAACASCVTGDLIIKPNDPDESFMMKKIQASVPGGRDKIEIGCGAAMPTPSMDFTYSAADKDCLVKMVQAFAASGG